MEIPPNGYINTDKRPPCILGDAKLQLIMNDFNKVDGPVIKKRNDLVFKHCGKLFDSGHRCIVIKPGSPFTYNWCGQKGDECEALLKKK